MNTPAPSTIDDAVYYDALSSPDTMTDGVPTKSGPSHTQDTKSNPSTSKHADPSPEYARGADTKSAARPEGSNVDTSAPTAQERVATAESSIPHSATSRLSKEEVKDAKRVSKVLKGEGRTDAKVLKAAISEFERLQTLHKAAAKDEASAISMHGKATKLEHKTNMHFLDAQAKHNSALADLQAREAALAATKEHVSKQSELLRAKEAEIKEMRGRKALEDREREAKLKQLTMSPTVDAPDV